MTLPKCETASELLVDYCDGRLPPAEAARVAAHLAECGRCRSQLALLDRSLVLAREIWQEAADEATLPDLDLPHSQRSRRRSRGRGRAMAIAAACVAAVLLTVGSWSLWRMKSVDKVNPADVASSRQLPEKTDEPRSVPPPISPGEHGDANAGDDVDVASLIARAGRAARLAASAELLATQPGLEQYREDTERYLAETYRGTPAGDRAARRIGTIPHKEPES
jgi:anti-sigma factor RsiW